MICNGRMLKREKGGKGEKGKRQGEREMTPSQSLGAHVIEGFLWHQLAGFCTIRLGLEF